MSEAPTVRLQHGARMPMLGLGTWPMDERSARAEVRTAIEAGYRLIDTAENYRNEAGVGRAIKDARIDREELFITSKFNREWHSITGVRRAWENSVQRLGVEYLDLFLIHWPNPDQGRFVEAWEGLCALHDDDLVHAIGTSNFKPAHLKRLIDATGVTPDVNQIQLSPAHPRPEAVRLHRELGIVTNSWSPLKPASVLESTQVMAVARAHGVTPAQAVLRWQVQQGFVPIPKSSSRVRQAQNLNVFGFELSDAEMASIADLDQGEAGVADSDEFGH